MPLKDKKKLKEYKKKYYQSEMNQTELLAKFIENNRDNLPISFIHIDKIHDSEDTVWKEEDRKTNFEKLAKFEKSIKKIGLKEPLEVRIEKMDGHNTTFTGVNGRHRYLAMKRLGYTIIPCRVLNYWKQ